VAGGLSVQADPLFPQEQKLYSLLSLLLLLYLDNCLRAPVLMYTLQGEVLALSIDTREGRTMV